jgi:SsrA-binding protein
MHENKNCRTIGNRLQYLVLFPYMNMLAENKKASFDYDILETFEAGLALTGQEVKSIKQGRAKLLGGHAIIRGNEAYIVGIHVPPYQEANMQGEYDPDRTRKALLTKREISYLTGKTAEKGLTLVPLRMYTNHGFVKVLLGLGRGKKKADKRHAIKARETKRTMERTLKGDA